MRAFARLSTRSSASASRSSIRARGILGLRLFLDARTVAGGLGLVATAAHVAPAPPTCGRGVVEGPAAAVVRADAQSFRAARRELLDDRLRDQCEGVVHGGVCVAVTDSDRGAVELEPS